MSQLASFLHGFCFSSSPDFLPRIPSVLDYDLKVYGEIISLLPKLILVIVLISTMEGPLKQYPSYQETAVASHSDASEGGAVGRILRGV